MNRAIPAFSLFVFLLAGQLSTAYAKPYLSGSLGYVDAEDSDLTGVYGGDGLSEVTFDGCIGFMLAVGSALPNGLRGEIELAYRYSDVDSINGPYNSYSISDVYVSSGALMANGYFDLMPNQSISPFIGGGVGFATVVATFEDDDIYYYDPYRDIYYYEDDYDSEYDTVFAYQLMAGLSFAVNPNLKIDLQYRYFATDDPDFDGVEIEYKTHNGLLGLRYQF